VAAYTSTSGGGNWSSSSTWTTTPPTGGPGSGDTVTIASGATVTVDAAAGPSQNGVVAIGTSPANQSTYVITMTGALTVAPNVLFTVKGNISLGGQTLTLNGGASLQFDSSGDGQGTHTPYLLVFGWTGNLVINGTSGNTCTFSTTTTSGGSPSNATFSGTSGNNVSITANYCVFSNMGDTAVKFIAYQPGSGCTLSLTNCTFSGCGAVEFTGAVSGSTLAFTGNTFASSLGYYYGSSPGVCCFALAATMSQAMTMAGNVFDLNVYLGYPGNVTISGNNYFQVGYYIGTQGWAGFSGNLVRMTSNAGVTDGGGMTGCYMLADHMLGNPHFLEVLANVAGSSVINGNIYDCTAAYLSDTGDCNLIFNPGSAATATIEYCIVLPGADGTQSGALATELGGANTTFVVNHNTACCAQGVATSLDYSGVQIGQGTPHSGEVTSHKSNLYWCAPGSTYPGYKWTRVNVTTQDVVAAANSDYNWGWNLSAGKDGNGYTYDANGGSNFSSGTPDTHPSTDTGNPQFVDTTRNFATAHIALFGNAAGTAWATGQGYTVGTIVSVASASVYANATINYRCIANHTSSSGDANLGVPGLATTTGWRTYWEFATANTLRNNVSLIATLISWVQNGYMVGNPLLNNAGADGVTIGAMQYLPLVNQAQQDSWSQEAMLPFRDKLVPVPY